MLAAAASFSTMRLSQRQGGPDQMTVMGQLVRRHPARFEWWRQI